MTENAQPGKCEICGQPGHWTHNRFDGSRQRRWLCNLCEKKRLER